MKVNWTYALWILLFAFGIFYIIGAFLPVLVQIAKDRPDILSSKEFRKILVDMGLPLENALEPETRTT